MIIYFWYFFCPATPPNSEYFTMFALITLITYKARSAIILILQMEM